MSEKFGKYDLERKLAVGGMAEVFLATQAGIGGFSKQVAIKRILAHLSEEKDFCTMFLDEARLVAKFNHSNIVQIFDVGIIDGRYFLAMEFIDGRNIARIHKSCSKQNVEMPLELAARITSQACLGLDYAHNFSDTNGRALNMVHRDVSPQNLMLTYDGAVKVVDFGIAKAASNLYKTKTLSLKGKIKYMSPEQITAEAPLDRRSDIYALGVVLFEFATGSLPHHGSTELQFMTNIVQEPAADPRDMHSRVPDNLAAIINKALRRDRDQRFADCREMRKDLEQFLVDGGRQVDDYLLADFLHWAVPKPGSIVNENMPPSSTPLSSSRDRASPGHAEKKVKSKTSPLTLFALFVLVAMGLAGLIWIIEANDQPPPETQIIEPWPPRPQKNNKQQQAKRQDNKPQSLLAETSKPKEKEKQQEETTSNENQKLKQKEKWRKKYQHHLTMALGLVGNPKKNTEAVNHLNTALSLSELAGCSPKEVEQLRGQIEELHRQHQKAAHKDHKALVAEKNRYRHARRYRKTGQKAYEEGNYRGALMAYKRSHKTDPSNAELYLDIAEAYEAIKNYKMAKKYCEKYLLRCKPSRYTKRCKSERMAKIMYGEMTEAIRRQAKKK